VSRRLDGEEIARALEALAGWSGDGAVIERTYTFPDFLTAVRGVDEIALVAEDMNHHPDLDIRWRAVRVALTTHDAGGVTQLDIEQAHRIAEIAARLGAAA
jgi:4a-hydroxytetrahydrobiopterin dehydratase